MSFTTNSCDNKRFLREIEALQCKAVCLQKQVCDLRAKKGCIESSLDRQRCAALKQIKCYLQKLQNVRGFLTNDVCQMNNVGLTSKMLMSDIERYMCSLKAEERRLSLASWCRNNGVSCPPITCCPDLCCPTDPCKSTCPSKCQRQTHPYLYNPYMPSVKCLDLVPHNVGRGGTAFFDQLCSDLWKCAYLPSSCPNDSMSCGTSWIRVIEVHQTGKYIKLVNTSCNKLEQISGHYLIQQQMGGCPLCVFKFPPRVYFPPQATIKVWSSCNDPTLHRPPTDFVFKQLLRWSVGADISTLLCRPNGQAIAWLAGCNVLCKDPCSTVPAPWFKCANSSNVNARKFCC